MAQKPVISASKETARHQIILNKERIDKALEQGYTKKEIWETLKNENKFTTTYSAFVNTFRRIENKIHKNKPTEPQKTEGTEPPKIEDIETREANEVIKGNSFVHNPIPDKNKLI